MSVTISGTTGISTPGVANSASETIAVGLTVGSAGITYSDASVQTTAFFGVGIGQTWQDLTASRAFSTPYTNATGKPITVMVTVSCPSQSPAPTVSVIVGGVTIASAGPTTNGPITFIVPASTAYQINKSGSPTLSSWAELR